MDITFVTDIGLTNAAIVHLVQDLTLGHLDDAAEAAVLNVAVTHLRAAIETADNPDDFNETITVTMPADVADEMSTHLHTKRPSPVLQGFLTPCDAALNAAAAQQWEHGRQTALQEGWL